MNGFPASRQGFSLFMTRAKKEPDRTTVLQVSEGLPGSLNIGQFLTIFPVLLPNDFQRFQAAHLLQPGPRAGPVAGFKLLPISSQVFLLHIKF